MILGISYNPSDAEYGQVVIPAVETMQDVVKQFTVELPVYTKEVSLAMLPICAFFAIFQLVSRKFNKHQLGRIGIGVVYTLIGLVLFLTGVNVGFIPVGSLLGGQLADSAFNSDRNAYRIFYSCCRAGYSRT